MRRARKGLLGDEARLCLVHKVDLLLGPPHGVLLEPLLRLGLTEEGSQRGPNGLCDEGEVHDQDALQTVRKDLKEKI